jgi:hypothetical protein
MSKGHSFRFLDDGLDRKLVVLLNRTEIDHSIDEDGVVHYAAADQEIVETDLICSIRDQVFSSWRIVTCPSDWIACYRDYMSRREIPFREELSDGQLWFLLPRKYRPHTWKLEGPMEKERLARSTPERTSRS